MPRLYLLWCTTIFTFNYVSTSAVRDLRLEPQNRFDVSKTSRGLMFASQRPTSTSQYLEEGGKELLLHRLQFGSLSLTSKATMAPLGGCLRLLMFFFQFGYFCFTLYQTTAWSLRSGASRLALLVVGEFIEGAAASQRDHRIRTAWAEWNGAYSLWELLVN
jgi:hypothetical protein